MTMFEREFINFRNNQWIPFINNEYIIYAGRYSWHNFPFCKLIKFSNTKTSVEIMCVFIINYVRQTTNIQIFFLAICRQNSVWTTIKLRITTIRYQHKLNRKLFRMFLDGFRKSIVIWCWLSKFAWYCCDNYCNCSGKFSRFPPDTRKTKSLTIVGIFINIDLNI